MNENTRVVPICTVGEFLTVDRYRSICSAIKCPLEITADDYFVALNGAVYDAIQTAYIVVGIMGYLRILCLPTTIILPASVCIPTYLYVLFVYVSVCASVQLEIHSLENTNKITDARELACSTFRFIFNFHRYYI